MVYHINQENWKLGMCNILEWSMNSNKKSKFINECKDHAEVCADLWDAPDDPYSLVLSPLCSPSHRERALLLSLSLLSLSLFSLPQQKDSYHVLSSPMRGPWEKKLKPPANSHVAVGILESGSSSPSPASRGLLSQSAGKLLSQRDALSQNHPAKMLPHS